MSDFEKKQRVIELINQHADMIYRVAMHNLKNPADAQDVFQEVCLSLLTKKAPLYDDVHIKYWLIRVTINKCRSLKKSVWHSKVLPLKDAEGMSTKCENMLLEELESLPTNYKNVIYLYYYEDYTIKEIAEILQKPQNTINTQLQRARKKLKKILQEGDDYEE